MARMDNNGKPEIKRSTGPYGINTIIKGGKKYMTRIWLGRLRVHIFYRGDEDRDPHDHPWSFWTFPLSSYVEEVTEKAVITKWNDNVEPPAGYETTEYRTRLQVVPAWHWNFRPAFTRQPAKAGLLAHSASLNSKPMKGFSAPGAMKSSRSLPHSMARLAW